MKFTDFKLNLFCKVLFVILILQTRTFFASSDLRNNFIDKNTVTLTNSFSELKNLSSNESYSRCKPCSPFINENLNFVKEYDTKKNLDYNKDLLKILPQNLNHQLYFHGYAEYAHFLKVDKVNLTSSEAKIILKGDMMDGYALQQRALNIEYTIDNDTVSEQVTVTNADDTTSQILNSLIPNQTILKLPLEVNNSWTQDFSYNNKKYKATTTITSIEVSDDVKKYITTTVINNIVGYLDNNYIEERTYEEGKGLIFFSRSTPLDGSFPYVTYEDNKFTYILDRYIENK